MAHRHWEITVRIPKPGKTWFQFSIGSLLIMTLGFAIFLSAGQGLRRETCDFQLFASSDLSSNDVERIELAFARARLMNWERRGRKIFVPRSEKEVFLKALSGINLSSRRIAYSANCESIHAAWH